MNNTGAECVPESYTGELCSQVLATIQSCTTGITRNTATVNASGVKQRHLETNLTTFFSILSEYCVYVQIGVFSVQYF